MSTKTFANRGSLLVDLLVTLFLIGVAGAIFSATFTAGFACSRKAQDYKVATAIAQRKVEQVRAMNYESLTRPLLLAAGVIDATPTESPYSFTQVDNLSSQLPAGTGTISVENLSSSVRRVRVTVTWQEKSDGPTRSVQLTTLFTDRRTRRVT